MKLTINSKGTFLAKRLMEDESKCGPIGRYKFGFDVTIVGDDTKLTRPNNFLIDAMVIPAYFKAEYTSNVDKDCKSCESMACEAVDYFRSLFYGTCGGPAPNPNDTVNLIQVRISGATGRYIEAVWEKEAKKPRTHKAPRLDHRSFS